MAVLRFEIDRGYGWQVRSEGSAPASLSTDAIRDEARKMALNGAVRAYLDGKLVFETLQLSGRMYKKMFGA